MNDSNCSRSPVVRASYWKSIGHLQESAQGYLPTGTGQRYGLAMTQVETARGPVDVARLGTTFMHEHVFILNEEIRQNYPQADWDEEERVADATVIGLAAISAASRKSRPAPTSTSSWRPAFTPTVTCRSTSASVAWTA